MIDKRAIFFTQIINNSDPQGSQNLLITFAIKVFLHNPIFLCFRGIWRRESLAFPEWQVVCGKTGAAIKSGMHGVKLWSYLFQCLFGVFGAFDPRPHTPGKTKSPECIGLRLKLGVICAPSQQWCLDLLIFGVTVKLLFGHTHIGLALFYGKCIAGCCRSDIQFT